ncbi:MAG: 16S rRNA (adenine(1518)-N(6)/adenine(1519)-N(6))-dimethyltransferase RsmA [Patescibacteria group bacterium]
MELASLEAVTFLCNQYNVRPDKRSGQNFLIDEAVLHAVAEAADLSSEDIILEIGPGFGVLTTELAKHAKQVAAVEMDQRLIPALKKIARAHNNIFIHEGDIFKAWPRMAREFPDQKYKLISNLPYNITSLVLRLFLEQRPRPSCMVVMVQQEVAERVTAKPGGFSLLTLAVQLYGEPNIVAPVNRKCFWPEPDVDSAILKIDHIGEDADGVLKKLGPDGLPKLWQIAKIGFSARRKQLHNNIASGLRLPDQKVREILENNGLNPRARAQELSVVDWVGLARIFKKMGQSSN